MWLSKYTPVKAVYPTVPCCPLGASEVSELCWFASSTKASMDPQTAGPVSGCPEEIVGGDYGNISR